MFKILDGRPHLWQWDREQKLLVMGLGVGTEVHFYNDAAPDGQSLPMLVYESEGKLLVDVPNILLTTSDDLMVYAHVSDAYGGRTTRHKKFVIKHKPKPSDYVYTETELQDYKTIAAESVAQIEKNNEQIDKMMVDYATNADKLKEAVEVADKYIGEYEYEELAFEIPIDAWSEFDGMYILETDADLSFLDPSNKDESFRIEIDMLDAESGTNMYVAITSESFVKITPPDMPNVWQSSGTCVTLMLQGIEFYVQVISGMNSANEMIETGGFIGVTMPVTMRIYKVARTLYQRISDIVDEINGEVI